jgi:Asp/Glu/hydantoin racemase
MTIGVLMLDTGFERFVGDIGNPKSFTIPVLHERIAGATVDRIVQAKEPVMVEPFIAGARRLIERGANAITTGCGFLVLHQAALAAALPVPVATSALMLIPLVARMLPPGRRVGVLTFSAKDLTPAHLAAAGASPDTPFEGVAEDGTFRRALRGLPVHDSIEARERDVIAAARALLARHSDIGAIVLECTNFPPHRAALARETGLPVFDIFTLIGLLNAATSQEELGRFPCNTSVSAPPA